MADPDKWTYMLSPGHAELKSISLQGDWCAQLKGIFIQLTTSQITQLGRNFAN